MKNFNKQRMMFYELFPLFFSFWCLFFILIITKKFYRLFAICLICNLRFFLVWFIFGILIIYFNTNLIVYISFFFSLMCMKYFIFHNEHFLCIFWVRILWVRINYKVKMLSKTYKYKMKNNKLWMSIFPSNF